AAGEAAQRAQRGLPGAVDQAPALGGHDARLPGHDHARERVERLLADALAALVDEERVAGDRAVPGHAPADHVALLVGGEFDPGAEGHHPQLLVARLLLGRARRQVGAAGARGVLAQARARLELHRQLGARGRIVLVAAAAGEARGDDRRFFRVVADLRERALDV